MKKRGCMMGNYPLPLWNVFESGSVHTNNHVEGRLKNVVEKAHPNSLSSPYNPQVEDRKSPEMSKFNIRMP